MTQSNVTQPSPQIAVGFGAVVKFREIYVLHTDALGVISSDLEDPIALGDLLSYDGENSLLPAEAGNGFRPAGFAANEAVVDSTGMWGYKPQAGDPLAVYKKGLYYCVNVEGVVVVDDELVAGVTPGSIRTRPAMNTDPTIGTARVGNGGVAGGPIQAEIDTTVVQAIA